VPERQPFLSRRAGGLASIAVGLVVVGPLFAPGFVLTYDMVFVPKPRLSRALLGISGAPPRAVPSALLGALLSRAVTGQVLEKLVLFAIFAGSAYGASRLVPAERRAARVAAGLLYAWNPFTYERLLLGHWALLVGYAALPWVAGAALAHRRSEPGASARLVLALAGAVAGGPYTGMLGGLLALSMAMCPPWTERPALGRWANLLGLVVLTNLAWLVPAALGPAVPGRPLLAEALFRARSDSPLGTVGSLLSLGGLWRPDLAPPGRSGFTWLPAFLIVAALTVAGWAVLGRRWSRGARAGLLVAAGLGLLLAAAPSAPGLGAAARWVARLPGGGFLRDSQKFVMPLALAGSVGFGLGVERLLGAIPSAGPSRRRMAAAVALLPVALAPTLAWGASGRLFTSRYPASWSTAERIVATDPEPGGILVLPWHAFLPFRWNRDRAVHQPALQYFSRPALASSALEVGSYRLPDEDPWAALARPVVLGRGSLVPNLRKLGVHYVLVFKEADWRGDLPRLIGLAPVLDTAELRLYRAAPSRVPSFPTPPVAPVVAGDVLTASVLVGASASLVRKRRRGSTDRP